MLAVAADHRLCLLPLPLPLPLMLLAVLVLRLVSVLLLLLLLASSVAKVVMIDGKEAVAVKLVKYQ